MEKQKTISKKANVHVCNKCFPLLNNIKLCHKISCQVIECKIDIIKEKFVIHLN